MRKVVVVCVLVVLVALTVLTGCRSPAMLHNQAGLALLKERKYEEALQEFSQAVESLPTYGEALNNRGVLYAYSGKYDLAIADFSKAIELDPKLADAYNNRGVAYAYLGEYDRAIADFTKAIEIDPKRVKALVNRLIVIQARDQKISSIADLEMYIEAAVSLSKGQVTCSLTTKRPPVLLVHGFQGVSFDPDKAWKELIEYLTGKDIYQPGDWELVAADGQEPSLSSSMKRLEGDCFVVYRSNYSRDPSQGTMESITGYARNLAAEIETIKKRENVSKVDIIAHSMGGLVSRAYIEGEDIPNNTSRVAYRNDVRKLIMLGTPNHGAYFAEFLNDTAGWTSVMQMKVGGFFLSTLNLGVTGNQKGVEYSAIAGNPYRCDSGVINPLLDLLCYLSGKKENDGVVTVESVRLDKQGSLPEIPLARWWLIELVHADLPRVPLSIIQEILITPVSISP